MSVEGYARAAEDRDDPLGLIDRELAVLALTGTDQEMRRQQIEQDVKRVAERLAERLPEAAGS
jgi:hypothetical protein